MLKKIYRILTASVLLIFVFTIGCSAPAIGSKADMSGYEGLTDQDHVFVVSDVSDFLKRLDDKETFTAYFGFSTCPWCNSAISILNELGKEFGQKILYINTRPNKNVTANNEIDGYDKLYERLKEYWDYYEEVNDNYLLVPYVIFIKDGEVAAYHTGTVEDHIAYVSEMTEDQRERLKDIYKEGFEGIR